MFEFVCVQRSAGVEGVMYQVTQLNSHRNINYKSSSLYSALLCYICRDPFQQKIPALALGRDLSVVTPLSRVCFVFYKE